MSADRYRRRPAEVEAVQYTGDASELERFAPNQVRVHPGGTRDHVTALAGFGGIDGWVPVPLSHWLVRGEHGALRVVGPHAFAADFERVDEPT